MDPERATLELGPHPQQLSLYGHPSGSFGGRTLPFNVALDAAGVLYLLDRSQLELKRFDPVLCDFEVVPCFGGEGPGARQLHDPNGIGICRGNLLVCDTGNHRVSVFTVHGLALRAHWSPPPGAAGVHPWEPYAVAFDARGCAYVSDRASGSLHRFSPSGRWLGVLTGLGPIGPVASDCRGHLYLPVEATTWEYRPVAELPPGFPPVVRIAHPPANAPLPAPPLGPDAYRHAPHFPLLPFPVSPEGHLHLRPWCHPTCTVPDATGPFNPHGNPLPAPTTGGSLRFVGAGTYTSEPLDSELYQCQWHRIVLEGSIPPGTRIEVRTYSAEVAKPVGQLPAKPEDWDTCQVVPALSDAEWDVLVRSPPGRYLWLQLELTGDGHASPRIDSIRIEFPRISLRRYLPAVFGEDPAAADFTDRFLALFDTTLRGIERTIDLQARYFDPLAAPTDPDPTTGVDALSWLASWIGVALDRRWSEDRRRRFLVAAGKLVHLRGTPEGLRRQLLIVLGMEPDQRCCPHDQPHSSCHPLIDSCPAPEPPPCAWTPPALILEHFRLRRWLFLGAGRLGERAELWGQRIVNRSQLDQNARLGVAPTGSQLKTSQDPLRDPFHAYAHTFTVFVPAKFERSDPHRRALNHLLDSESPAHTRHHIEYVAPRFRIGVQAAIGFDAVVGRYPEGVTLSATNLGPASVLGTIPVRAGRPNPANRSARSCRLHHQTGLAEVREGGKAWLGQTTTSPKGPVPIARSDRSPAITFSLASSWWRGTSSTSSAT